jgi:hypothetical protein
MGWGPGCLLLFKKRKRKKGRNSQGAFFPWQTCPIGCAMPGIFWLLDAVKSSFKGQNLNFMYTLYVDSYNFS